MLILYRLPLRVAIELLSSRVDQLCLFIRANGLEAPPMSQEKDTALMKVLDVLGLTEVHSTFVPTQEQRASYSKLGVEKLLNNPLDKIPPAADTVTANESNGAWGQPSPDSISQTSQTNLIQIPSPQASSALPIFPEVGNLNVSVAGAYPPTDNQPENPLSNLDNWDWTIDFADSLTPPSPEIQSLSAEALQVPLQSVEMMPEPYKPPPTQGTASLDKDAKSPEEIEDLIDELSDRVGTLRFGPEGQSYFYGPTSTFNLTEDDTPVSDTQPTRTSIYNGIDFDTAVPTALQDHLLNLYFTWQDPSFHVIDREMFEKGKLADLRTPYYSDALLYAM